MAELSLPQEAPSTTEQPTVVWPPENADLFTKKGAGTGNMPPPPPPRSISAQASCLSCTKPPFAMNQKATGYVLQSWAFFSTDLVVNICSSFFSHLEGRLSCAPGSLLLRSLDSFSSPVERSFRCMDMAPPAPDIQFWEALPRFEESEVVQNTHCLRAFQVILGHIQMLETTLEVVCVSLF